jgi:hypothetical protein
MDNEEDATTEWYWEGNVVDALARYFAAEGWSVVSQADTRSRARGTDLHLQRAEKTLLIEAKGFPSTSYRDPTKAGLKKPTSPTLQAQHWYSHALLKVMRLQTEFPLAKVAMGFPDFPRYRALFEETRTGLNRLGVAICWVREDQSVETSDI